MSSSKQKPKGEYALLQRKLLFRASWMMILAVIVVFLLYRVFLRGRFANAAVSVLTYFLKDYPQARGFYSRILRSNIEFLFAIAITLVFLVILRLYIASFTKYFNEIARGIDSLAEESAEGVILSPELSQTQRKIEDIRGTLRQRKEEARLTEERKNEMIAYLAHDLKTPLCSVIGYLSLLRDEEQMTEDSRQKSLDIALEKATRLEDLIDELFDIAKFNCSKVELSYQEINLTTLLQQVISEFQPMLRRYGLKCELDTPADVKISCDGSRLQRVFDNLLRNALSYSTPETCIHVEVRPETDKVRVRVTNAGSTIPPELLEKIFEQFYRLDASRGSASGGSGLGLAIAREIMELHRGSITAESVCGYTTFTVCIPVHKPA